MVVKNLWSRKNWERILVWLVFNIGGIVNLTEKEKKAFNNSRDEETFYSNYTKVRQARNGFLPNYLVREVLEIFNIKFPKDHSEDWWLYYFHF